MFSLKVFRLSFTFWFRSLCGIGMSILNLAFVLLILCNPSHQSGMKYLHSAQNHHGMYTCTDAYILWLLINGFYRPNINACEISAIVYLPVAFLNKYMPYKYVIYSAPLSSGTWESIHDLPIHGAFNRCLELNQSSSDSKFSYLKW